MESGTKGRKPSAQHQRKEMLHTPNSVDGISKFRSKECRFGISIPESARMAINDRTTQLSG